MTDFQTRATDERGRPPLGGLVLFVAAESEVRAILAGGSAPPRWSLAELSPGIELCLTGIGKANAAGAAARLLDPTRHRAAISIGIGGSLPGGPPLGSTVVGTASAWADEGVRTPTEFLPCSRLGFPIGPYSGELVPVDEPLSAAIARCLGAVRGVIATVSSCSGTDAGAGDVAARCGAIAEGMEGAAVGHAAAMLGIPFVEVRAISNTTGDRVRQVWEMGPGLAALADAACAVAAVWRGGDAARPAATGGAR